MAFYLCYLKMDQAYLAAARVVMASSSHPYLLSMYKAITDVKKMRL